MTPRAIGAIARTIVAVFAAAAFGALSVAGVASAQAPAKPSPKASNPTVLTITITGPGVSPPIVIRSTEDPTLYAQVAAQVQWMNSATGNVMPSAPTQLGPDYTVTMTTGARKTAVYDLYPLVASGPRAHRAAIGSRKAAWFFGSVSMANGLEAAGVIFPTSSASGEVAPPTVATSAPSTSLSKIMAQSKVALGLAAVAAAGVLMMLALAARRSRRLDRRRAMPAAIARLETVANRARTGSGLDVAALATSGAGLRRAVPAARVGTGASKATGTARVPQPGQPAGLAPDAAPGSASGSRVTGTTASVPPRTDAAPTGPSRSGPAVGSAPVGSAPAGRPTGTAYGTPRTNQHPSDPSHGDSGAADRVGANPRPPGPRGAADAPVETPDEVAVGTAHVVATAGMAPAAASALSAESALWFEAAHSAGATGGDTTGLRQDDDRPVGVAPAPRAPADDMVKPATDDTTDTSTAGTDAAGRTNVVADDELARDSDAADDGDVARNSDLASNNDVAHDSDMASDDDAVGDSAQPIDEVRSDATNVPAGPANGRDDKDSDGGQPVTDVVDGDAADATTKMHAPTQADHDQAADDDEPHVDAWADDGGASAAEPTMPASLDAAAVASAASEIQVSEDGSGPDQDGADQDSAGPNGADNDRADPNAADQNASDDDDRSDQSGADDDDRLEPNRADHDERSDQNDADDGDRSNPNAADQNASDDEDRSDQSGADDEDRSDQSGADQDDRSDPNGADPNAADPNASDDDDRSDPNRADHDDRSDQNGSDQNGSDQNASDDDDRPDPSVSVDEDRDEVSAPDAVPTDSDKDHDATATGVDLTERTRERG